MANVMVELLGGYGDGYGVVSVDDAGRPKIEPNFTGNRYEDGGKIEAWRLAILRHSTHLLTDAGVKVPVGAIARVIGTMDCPEAVKVRVKRCLRNATSGAREAVLASATHEEMVEALKSDGRKVWDLIDVYGIER